MQRNTIRRVVGYGLGAGVAAALVFVGATASIPPGPDHFLLQAEIKLRYATQLAPTDANGAPVPVREALIRDAEAYLTQAEALRKDSPLAVEYRGYIHFLRGDARAAAASYRRAEGLLTADAQDAKGELRVNEARMLSLAGDDAAALSVLQAGGGVLGTARAAAEVETARILRRADRSAEALVAARAAAGHAQPTDRAWIDAGDLLEELGDDATAASTYERVRPTQPLGNYRAARLKAKAGEFDIATEMLERAIEGMGPEVRRLVDRDADIWRSMATTGRFMDLFEGAAHAEPGR